MCHCMAQICNRCKHSGSMDSNPFLCKFAVGQKPQNSEAGYHFPTFLPQIHLSNP